MIKVFKKCLDWLEETYAIKNGYRYTHRNREWLDEQLANKVPNYFWYTPASISLKHHPEWALGSSGLQLHTLAVAQTVLELSETRDPFEVNPGQMFVAAILHDTFKYGAGPAPSDIRVYHKMHMLTPGFAFDWPISDVAFYNGVKRLIETHMGRWSPPGYKPETDKEWLLQEADYLMSRRNTPAPSIVEVYKNYLEVEQLK